MAFQVSSYDVIHWKTLHRGVSDNNVHNYSEIKQDKLLILCNILRLLICILRLFLSVFFFIWFVWGSWDFAVNNSILIFILPAGVAKVRFLRSFYAFIRESTVKRWQEMMQERERGAMQRTLPKPPTRPQICSDFIHKSVHRWLAISAVVLCSIASPLDVSILLICVLLFLDWWLLHINLWNRKRVSHTVAPYAFFFNLVTF